MRVQKYNEETKQFEWVYAGDSHAGAGTSDFHRHQRIKQIVVDKQNRKIEWLGKMSKYRRDKYCKTIDKDYFDTDDLRKKTPLPKYDTMKTQRGIGKSSRAVIPGGQVESVYKEKYLGIKKEPKDKYTKYID